MLTPKEFNKLIHDLKRCSTQLTLAKEIKQKKIRDKMFDLLAEELDRLYADLKDMKTRNGGGQDEMDKR